MHLLYPVVGIVAVTVDKLLRPAVLVQNQVHVAADQVIADGMGIEPLADLVLTATPSLNCDAGAVSCQCPWSGQVSPRRDMDVLGCVR